MPDFLPTALTQCRNQPTLQTYSDPIRIVKGFHRKSFSQSPFTIQSFTSHLGLLWRSDQDCERFPQEILLAKPFHHPVVHQSFRIAMEWLAVQLNILVYLIAEQRKRCQILRRGGCGAE
jgi:hypothetical protein